MNARRVLQAIYAVGWAAGVVGSIAMFHHDRAIAVLLGVASMFFAFLATLLGLEE